MFLADISEIVPANPTVPDPFRLSHSIITCGVCIFAVINEDIFSIKHNGNF